jgi:hypothetical protein
MRVFVAVALVLSCKSIETFPPGEGGGGGGIGGGGGGGGDAKGSGIDAPGNTIMGRACLVSDFRILDACAATGAGGFTVTLGAATPATTIDDGGFAILAPNGTNLIWKVEGSNMETSLMAFGTQTPVLIPVISVQTYQSTSDNFGVTDFTDSAVFVAVSRQGSALEGEVAKVTPASTTLLYDDIAADTWGTDLTHGHGVVWATGLTGSSAQVQVEPATAGSGDTGSGSGDGLASGIVLGSASLTFVQLDTF